jgi:uncharacterized membrane protein
MTNVLVEVVTTSQVFALVLEALLSVLGDLFFIPIKLLLHYFMLVLDARGRRWAFSESLQSNPSRYVSRAIHRDVSSLPLWLFVRATRRDWSDS